MAIDVPAITDEIIKGIKLQDEMENEVQCTGLARLTPPEREQMYIRDIESVEEGAILFSASCAEETFEHVVKYVNGAYSEVLCTCMILYEEMPPTKITEFQFEDGVWRLSKCCADAIENYRGSKFKSWEETFKNTDCKATLRRLTEIGLVTTLFDHLAFPEPENLKDQYQVINDKGKVVNVPHPVKGLRNWDANSKSYQPMQARLEGAPAQEDEKAYYDNLCTETCVEIRLS